MPNSRRSRSSRKRSSSRRRGPVRQGLGTPPKRAAGAPLLAPSDPRKARVDAERPLFQPIKIEDGSASTNRTSSKKKQLADAERPLFQPIKVEDGSMSTNRSSSSSSSSKNALANAERPLFQPIKIEDGARVPRGAASRSSNANGALAKAELPLFEQIVVDDLTPVTTATAEPLGPGEWKASPTYHELMRLGFPDDERTGASTTSRATHARDSKAAPKTKAKATGDARARDKNLVVELLSPDGTVVVKREASDVVVKREVPPAGAKGRVVELFSPDGTMVVKREASDVVVKREVPPAGARQKTVIEIPPSPVERYLTVDANLVGFERELSTEQQREREQVLERLGLNMRRKGIGERAVDVAVNHLSASFTYSDLKKVALDVLKHAKLTTWEDFFTNTPAQLDRVMLRYEHDVKQKWARLSPRVGAVDARKMYESLSLFPGYVYMVNDSLNMFPSALLAWELSLVELVSDAKLASAFAAGPIDPTAVAVAGHVRKRRRTKREMIADGAAFAAP